MNRHPSTHPSAEELQAFLEQELPSRARSLVEEHVSGCPRCSAELDAWGTMFAELGGLASHRPHEGFSSRVMAAVQIPAPRSLADRVRDRVAMALRPSGEQHLTEDVIQDFLDGEFAARRASRIERHLAACDSCATEAATWHAVLHQLGELKRFEPSTGFSDRVMCAMDLPAGVSLHEPLAARVAVMMRGPRQTHLGAGILQDFVDGALPARAAARVRTHLGGCASCAREAHAWKAVTSQLDGLEQLAPSVDFGERVMRGLALRPQTAENVAPAAIPLRLRLVARLRRLVPETREAWAALSGMAVTPVAIAGVMAYAVFSHPAVTVGSLASFVWWQVTDMASAATTALTSTLFESGQLFGVGSFAQTLAASPAMVVGGALLYTLVSAFALRVLYTNLITNRPSRGRYAHASTAS